MRTGTPIDRWRELGAGSGLQLDRIELHMVELPFLRPIETAKVSHRSRPIVLVHLSGHRSSDPPSGVDGWGECAALADGAYDGDDVPTSMRELRTNLLPRLRGFASAKGGRVVLPSDVPTMLGDPERDRSTPGRTRGPVSPPAVAALEMAVADMFLRAEGTSFATLLGVEGALVEAGAVVGRAPSIDQLVSSVGLLVDAGYRRVKVKIGPGWDVVPMTALCGTFTGTRFQVDANGSYEDPGARQWGALDRLGLLCIEQPFDRHDLGSHVALARRLTTPICLDESFDSPDSVEVALDAGACSVVCVKPGRLGGIGAALAVLERCHERGVPLWMGGMFESGYARGMNATLAALPGFAWPGDLSPARTYLADDLVPEPHDRSQACVPHRSRTGFGSADRAPAVAVIGSPGLGPVPDAAKVDRYLRSGVRLPITSQ